MTGGVASRSQALVVNADYAPTFAAAAGVEPPAGAEGRSLLSLIDGSAPRWRKQFLIEHWGGKEVPAYCGIRSQSWMYALYSTGEEELYDLRSDPIEIQNLAADPAAQAKRVALRSMALRRCARRRRDSRSTRPV